MKLRVRLKTHIELWRDFERASRLIMAESGEDEKFNAEMKVRADLATLFWNTLDACLAENEADPASSQRADFFTETLMQELKPLRDYLDGIDGTNQE